MIEIKTQLIIKYKKDLICLTWSPTSSKRATLLSLPSSLLDTSGPSPHLVRPSQWVLYLDIGRKPQKVTRLGADPTWKASWRFIRSWVCHNHKLYYTYVLICTPLYLILLGAFGVYQFWWYTCINYYKRKNYHVSAIPNFIETIQSLSIPNLIVSILKSLCPYRDPLNTLSSRSRNGNSTSLKRRTKKKKKLLLPSKELLRKNDFSLKPFLFKLQRILICFA